VDSELHELELRLDDVRRNVVVSEPGVGGECPECGELFGSAAHYCSHCGLPLTESARRAFSRIVAAQPHAVAAPPPAVAAQAPAPADQATQELPALQAEQGTVFHWPPREPAPEEPPADEAPTQNLAPKADEPAGDDPAATAEPAEDASANGEPVEDANAEPEKTAEDAPANAEPEKPAEDAPANGDPGKPGDDSLFTRAERGT
jgi:hypothetical protein